eukprot:20382-Heterococcus_DN1.PRE.6
MASKQYRNSPVMNGSAVVVCSGAACVFTYCTATQSIASGCTLAVRYTGCWLALNRIIERFFVRRSTAMTYT